MGVLSASTALRETAVHARQVLGIPPDTFKAAQSASRLMRDHLGRAHGSAAASHVPDAAADPIALLIAAGEDLPHGLVAAALPRMLSGQASLRAPRAPAQVCLAASW